MLSVTEHAELKPLHFVALGTRLQQLYHFAACSAAALHSCHSMASAVHTHVASKITIPEFTTQQCCATSMSQGTSSVFLGMEARRHRQENSVLLAVIPETTTL